MTETRLAESRSRAASAAIETKLAQITARLSPSSVSGHQALPSEGSRVARHDEHFLAGSAGIAAMAPRASSSVASKQLRQIALPPNDRSSHGTSARLHRAHGNVATSPCANADPRATRVFRRVETMSKRSATPTSCETE